MTLLEHAARYEKELRMVGRSAIEESRKHGVPAYYMDPALGEGLIRELPDGTRQRIRLEGREDVVVETLAPGH